MNDEPLMDAVVQAVVFLECSDSETVDEDAAVQMLEQIAATLQRLEPDQKNRFLNYLKQCAASADSEQDRHAYEAMPGQLGLREE